MLKARRLNSPKSPFPRRFLSSPTVLARITTIADSFDAMNSRRSYREPLSTEIIIREFEKCKGSQFDPEITDVFLDIFKNHFDEIKEIQEKYKA